VGNHDNSNDRRNDKCIYLDCMKGSSSFGMSEIYNNFDFFFLQMKNYNFLHHTMNVYGVEM